MKFLDWVDAQAPLRRLGLFRIVIGLMVLRHAVPYVQEALAGKFPADRFYVPYQEFLTVEEGPYRVLLAVMVGAGLALAIGVKARAAAWIAFFAVALHYLQNQLFYSNNKILLILFLLLLALSPAHRVLAGTSKEPASTMGPAWTMTAIRGQMSLVYLASGISKLLDADWRNGAVLGERLASFIPPESFLGSAPLRWTLGLGAIGTEIFLGLGLWFATTRRAALWLGFLFHATVELLFSVLVFSHVMLAGYFLVARPEERTRILRYDAGKSSHRTFARVVRRLDWLGRVACEHGPREAFRVRDGGGRWYKGWMAVAVILSALPLTFPIAFPVSLLRRSGSGLIAGMEAGGARSPYGGEAWPELARFAPLVIGILAAATFAGDVLRMGGTGAKLAWALLVVAALTLATAADRERAQ